MPNAFEKSAHSVWEHAILRPKKISMEVHLPIRIQYKELDEKCRAVNETFSLSVLFVLRGFIAEHHPNAYLTNVRVSREVYDGRRTKEKYLHACQCVRFDVN